MAQGGTLQEYLVSLGVAVDQKGINKLHNALNTTKQSALGIGAVLAASTVIITKYVLKLNATAQQYEEMARKSNMSVKAITAQETALKVLGKTLKEVEKDSQLSKRFAELKKLGKELALPTTYEGLTGLRSLLGEIDRFRVFSVYAINWVNAAFLTKLRKPMAHLQGQIEKIRKKVTENMPQMAAIVGGGLANIIRLVMSLVDLGEDLFDWFREIPIETKRAGAGLAALWAAMNMSPVQWLVAGLVLLLGVIQDYYGWKNGENALLGDLWEDLEAGNLLGGLLEKLQKVPDAAVSLLQTFTGFGQQIADKIVEGISTFDFVGTGTALGTFVSNLFTKLAAELSGDGTFNLLQTLTDAAKGLVEGLVNFLSSFLGAIEWDKVASSVTTGFGNLFTFIFSNLFGEEATADSPEKQGLIDKALELAGGLITTILQQLNELNLSDVAVNLAGMVKKLFEYIGKAFGVGVDANDPNKLSVVEKIMGIVMDLAKGILEQIGKIEWDKIGVSVGGIVDTLFAFLGQIFGTSANATQEAKDGLLQKALDLVKGLAIEVLNQISSIDWGGLGVDVGGFINKLFAFIGDLVNPEGKGDDWLSPVLGSVIQLANQIVTFLINALSQIKPEDVSNAITGALDKLFSLLSGGLDGNSTALNDFGSKIGELIGKAIVFVGTLVGDLATKLYNMINSDEGREQFNKIGELIGQFIGAGMESMLAVIWDAIFGEGSFQKMKGNMDLLNQGFSGVKAVDANGNELTKQQQYDLATNDPAGYAAAIKRGQDVDPWSAAFSKSLKDLGVQKALVMGKQGILEDAPIQASPGFNLLTPSGWAYNSLWNDIAKEYRDAMAVKDASALGTATDKMLFFKELYKEKGMTPEKLKEAIGTLSPIVEVTNAKDAAKNANDQMQQYADAHPIQQDVIVQGGGVGKNFGGGENDKPNAYGGFYSYPTSIKVGEDYGEEAVIPLGKISRRNELIKQMFSKMGSGARDLLKSMGIIDNEAAAYAQYGAPGQASGAQPASMYPMVPGDSSVSKSLLANTNIYVYGSGDANAAGQAAYRATEKNLLRHIKGGLEA